MRKGKTVADAKMKNAHSTIGHWKVCTLLVTESLRCLLIYSKKHYDLVQLLEKQRLLVKLTGQSWPNG